MSEKELEKAVEVKEEGCAEPKEEDMGGEARRSSMEDAALLPPGKPGYQASIPSPGARVNGKPSLWAVLLQCLPYLLLVLVVAITSYSAGERMQQEKYESDKVSFGTVRPLQKLDKPRVILISSDGFRWGFNHKVPTPNIDRLRSNGTEAATGMIPVYPSLTFPNHYSIATGLYPASHGIVANYFSDPSGVDVKGFYPGNNDPKWWGGEPIWVTATRNGLIAATYFWPGSEAPKDPWTCPKEFCQTYNGSVPYDERVDTVLGYMDLPAEKRPDFVSLYFESPDKEAHRSGPDSPEVSSAVVKIDALIGRLIGGLEERGIFEDVTMMFVGDHGMATTCDAKMIYLVDMNPWAEINESWIDSYGALLTIRPPPEVNAKDLYTNMTLALASGEVENSKYLELYLREDMPERYHYSGNDRVEPIIGIPAEGFKVSWDRKPSCGAECGGQHGYDNSLLSMRTIFIAHGPQFARGRLVPSFRNIELYNIMTTILGLKDTAANNGSSSFASTLLLSPA